MILLSIPKNIDKFRSMSVNIIFGVPIVIFYFKEIYFLLMLFSAYFVYDLVTQTRFYRLLYRATFENRMFLLGMLLLFIFNTSFTYLYFDLKIDIFKYLAWASIWCSTWYGSYVAGRCYVRNKNLIDKYFNIWKYYQAFWGWIATTNAGIGHVDIIARGIANAASSQWLINYRMRWYSLVSLFLFFVQ